MRATWDEPVSVELMAALTSLHEDPSSPAHEEAPHE